MSKGNVLGRKAYLLDNAVGKLEQRWLALHNLGLTHQEFLSLFAPPEHHELLARASEIADIRTDHGSVCFPWIRGDKKLKEALGASDAQYRMDVNVINGNGILLPRGTNVLPGAPPALVEKLVDWTIEYAQIKLNFNRIRLLLNWMDRRCTSSAQIRSIWPQVVQLAMLNESTKDFGDKLRDIKPVMSLPHIPPEVRQACKDSAMTLTAAALLPEPEDFTAPVVVTVNTLDTRQELGALGILTA